MSSPKQDLNRDNQQMSEVFRFALEEVSFVTLNGSHVQGDDKKIASEMHANDLYLYGQIVLVLR